MKKSFILFMVILLIVSNNLFVFADEQPLEDKLLIEQVNENDNQELQDNTIDTLLLNEGIHTENLDLEQDIAPFIYDDTKPELIGEISIDKTEVEAPGVITVTARAKDDLSGIDSFRIDFISDNKNYYAYMQNKFYDYTEGKYIEYGDNVFKGTIVIDTYDKPGVFNLYSVDLIDKTGNSAYYKDDPYSNYLSLPNSLYFKVNNSEYDDTPPELIGEISIDKTEVEAPGVITVTARAKDDLSGIDSFRIYFRSDNKNYYANMQNRFYDYTEGEYVEYGDNIFKGTIRIKTYDKPGVFNLYSVRLSDKTGNSVYYEDDPYLNSLPLPNSLSFNLSNSEYDDTKPELIGEISIDKTEVEAPGVITVTARAKDNLSGIDFFRIDFRSSNKNYYANMQNRFYDYTEGEYVEYEDNIFKGTIVIDTYDKPGVFNLDSVYLSDRTGNGVHYEDDPYSNYLPLPNKLSYILLNDNPADLATNTDNPNLVDDIKSQPNDALILINYNTGSKIDDNIFNAIKDTDKTIVFQGNGVEWVFNGKDIDNPKDIDLNVGVNLINNYHSDNSNVIEELVQDVPTIVLSFPENGVLPGKAKIRIKADYTFKNYLGIENLYVYFYDNTNEKLVPVASSLNVLEADEYLEFEIFHNSDFIITKGEIPLISSDLDLCDITSITSPKDAIFSEDDKTIIYKVPYKTTSQLINVVVSDEATWKLYSDYTCKNEIKDNNMNLDIGSSNAYIKVSSKSGLKNKLYTINIIREANDTDTDSSNLDLCDITAITSPKDAIFSEHDKTIIYKVPYKTTSQLIDVVVSDEATWKLYSDYTCKNEIKDNNMNLDIGSNNAYIKVSSKSGLKNKLYTINIIREANNIDTDSSNLDLCDITSITSPKDAIFSKDDKTIIYKVPYKITSQVIDVVVSDEAAWKLYSDYTCKNEIKDNNMNLDIGSNNAYIKVSSKSGLKNKLYTINIIREANDIDTDSSNNKSSNNNLSSTSSMNTINTVQDNINKKITFINEETTAKTIQLANTKGQSPKIIIREDLNSAIFKGIDLITNATNKHDLIFVNDNINVSFTPTLIEELKLKDNSKVEVILSSTNTVKGELLKTITNIDLINKDMIKYNYILKIMIDGEEVTNVKTPINLIIKNITRNLTDKQQNNLTGIVFDKDLQKYVQLGGEFDNYNNLFSFYTNQFGIHGLIVSNDLTKIKFKVDNKYYNINNKTYNNDVAPIISNERVMLPLRLISETLGAKVTWDTSLGVATIIKDNKTIEVKVNKPLENDMGIPIILNDRVYVPIRHITEILEANIIWNDDLKEIDIYK